MRKSTASLALVLLILGTGCGTIANMRGETVISLGGPCPNPTVPFGGITQDVRAAREMPGGVLLIADLPFSFVGDIVTLPWATYKSMQHRETPKKAENQEE